MREPHPNTVRVCKHARVRGFGHVDPASLLAFGVKSDSLRASRTGETPPVGREALVSVRTQQFRWVNTDSGRVSSHEV